MSDLLGKRLGPYQIQEVIRFGGMATIYKAYQASLDRNVAVKVMFSNNDPQFAARFQREARAVAQLQHPNIVQIYDYGEQDGQFYLTMQYIEEGRSLTDIQGQPLSLEQILRLIVHVLAALGHAHKRGIVHRDIKPSNILLAGDMWPMLIDFGIAKLLDDNQNLTRTGIAIGTPAYMAPEQAEGRSIDARTDLYSLGVVLYELVTGQVPFSAETPMAILMKHVYAPPPPPRSIKPELPAMIDALLMRALAKEPAARYQTTDDMAAALNRMIFQLEQSQSQGTLVNLYGLAQQAFEEGHWDAAVEQLNQLMAVDPGFKDSKQLLEAAEAARERSKNKADQTPFTPADHYANELFKLGQTMEQRGDLNGAINQYQAALSVAANGQLHARLASSIANIQMRLARQPTSVAGLSAVPVPPPESANDKGTANSPIIPPSGRSKWMIGVIVGALALLLIVGGVAFAGTGGGAILVPTGTPTSSPTIAATATTAPSATSSPTVIPSATSAPTDTAVPPTDTAVPTATPEPPTATPEPPTATAVPTDVPPTDVPVKVAPPKPTPPRATVKPKPTPKPAVATAVPEPPTAVPEPPTAVPEPPTAVPEPPTAVPPTATKKPKNNGGGGGGGGGGGEHP